jgi:DNA primase
MARYGDNAIDEVRQRTDIVEIIGAHVRLRRTGRNFVGLCPFHNEKTPSFSVNAERGFYHCFGCGAGGTVFNFIMKVEGLTFPEAIRSLATRYGVSLPELKNDGPAAAERDALTRANQTAAEFYAHVLWNTHDGELAREYLRSRGITLETARAFMLGFSPARPASLAKALEKRGLTEAGVKAGVVKRDAMGLHDAFRARVMFPIRDAQGKVIAFGGRVLDARMPKYLNSPETPAYSKTRTLYGLPEARQAIASQDRVIIVEGYFDVIALWQAGFRETVASCGTSLTVEQLRLLSRYTKNVFACFDGDEAGRKASLRALEIFLQAGLLGRGIFIPTGFDPDTLVRERGAAFLEELIGSSELLVDYFLKEQAREAKSLMEGEARAAERVAEMLKLVANPFEFDLLARKAAELLHVGEDTLRKAGRSKQQPSRNYRRPEISTVPVHRNTVEKAEMELIATAIWFPELRAEIAKVVPFSELGDQIALALMTVCDSEKPGQSLLATLGDSLSPDQIEFVAEKGASIFVHEERKVRKPFSTVTFKQLDETIWKDLPNAGGTLAESPSQVARRTIEGCLALFARRKKKMEQREERERRNAS